MGIENVKVCSGCIPWVYPLAFDDCCLTIPQQIAKITSKLNEVIDSLNMSDEQIRGYVDSQVAMAIAESKRYTDEQLSEQLTEILTMFQAVYCYAENLNRLERNYVDAELNKIWYQIRTLQNMGNCIVIDPTTSKQNSLQSTLDNMYKMFRYFALTASVYDSLMITADEYGAYKVTAYRYDYWGLLIFRNNWFKSQFIMFHPATGEIVDYKTIIYWLVNFHKPSPLTAEEYDGLTIEASNYDVYDMSAYQYDFTGKQNLQS